ncbi:uncharacterized protein Z518_08941 [Rhinocladiella mackenziei CBS 650.93]|uniref:Uncharacterized protein n=1 Tax=Rhinocladiella mackenziei CBS 650.93 TaxID=1442369 RepID=A0A0D2IDB0_9EURO|nr:uncharacterized protein Z518_08941 [Rhinocladiella mackenziei CBS 650.93]KIX01216.1 hypothetical protein Z518_08941 [Rhinocladiella mackenziei CBS 650.93]
MASPLSSPQVGFTSSPHQRGTLDIIWSCLFTVFICTWTVVHPNIPPRRSPWWHRLLDRLIELVLAAVAPELILAVAVREWLDAKGLVMALKDFERDKSDEPKEAQSGQKRGIVTGFYVVMQVRFGKVTHDFNFNFPFANNDDDAETKVEGYLSIPDIKEHLCLNKLRLSALISESEIWDKGNADRLIKCMLVFQVLGYDAVYWPCGATLDHHTIGDKHFGIRSFYATFVGILVEEAI